MRRKGVSAPKTADEYIRVFKDHTIPITNADLKGQKFYQGFGIIEPAKLLEAID